MLLLKNLQFLLNHYETWPKLVTYELLNLTKFHADWKQIVDLYLLIAYIWASVIFYYSVSNCFVNMAL